MPNWCANRVTVWSDDVAKLQEFKDLVRSKEEPFSFNSISPMPEELRTVASPTQIVSPEEVDEHKRKNQNTPFYSGSPITQETYNKLMKEYGCSNWYDWADDNWGVKWECSNVECEESYGGNEAVYRFNTPWGPPEEIYNLLVRKFPDLAIQWFWDEPGMEMAGYLQPTTWRSTEG